MCMIIPVSYWAYFSTSDPVPQMKSLIEFARQLYQQPGIQTCCLQLQDDLGIDVPFLLYLCWHGACAGRLPAPQASAALDHSLLMSGQVIHPLRQVRRWMKAGWPSQPELREQIKSAELQAEFALLGELEAYHTLPTRDSKDAVCSAGEAAIAANLAWYFGALQVAPADIVTELLVNAAMQCIRIPDAPI